MDATGLPIATAAAPQAPKAGQADTTGAAAENPEGGFSDTLMQLLGLAEPASDVPALVANPLIQALLDGVDEDTGSTTATDAAALLAMLTLMQPSDLRSAQAVARHAGAGALDAIAATGASLDAVVSAALAEGAQDPKTLLKEPGADALSQTGDAPAQSLLSGALQSLTQEALSTTRPPPHDSAVSRQLQAPVGTNAWSDELGARLQLMTEKGHHAASLRLAPEHLGPLEVQISVKDDQATVWFGASNVDTRAALEQALPRLRELFAAQGMSLAHSGVFQQPQQTQGQARPASGGVGASGETADISESATITVRRRGLLDAYA